MPGTLITFNNLESAIVLPAIELTTSYVTSGAISIEGANQLQLLVSFTKGDSDGCYLKVEYSENRKTWYQESMVSGDSSAGEVVQSLFVRKIIDSGNYVISIPVCASFFRVSAQAITTGAGTSLSILASRANI